MFTDKNNSLYKTVSNGTSIEINKKNVTIINNGLFIYEIEGKKLKIHTHFEHITKNVIKFVITNSIIVDGETTGYIFLEHHKISLIKSKDIDNESLEELKSLLEEYKEETNSLKTFVGNKLNGKQKIQSQTQFPKR